MNSGVYLLDQDCKWSFKPIIKAVNKPIWLWEGSANLSQYICSKIYIIEHLSQVQSKICDKIHISTSWAEFTQLAMEQFLRAVQPLG